jgi:hypothetical protein
MIKVLVMHKINNDFKTWKKSFDSSVHLLKQNGVLNYSTGTTKDDPKNVYVLCEVERIESFNKLWNMKELKDAIHKSGVIEEPHVTILNEIEKKEFAYHHAHS